MLGERVAITCSESASGLKVQPSKRTTKELGIGIVWLTGMVSYGFRRDYISARSQSKMRKCDKCKVYISVQEFLEVFNG